MDKNLLQKAFDVAENQIEPKMVEEILTKIVIESLKSYQRKINIGVQDSFSDLLDSFKHKVAEIIFDHGATWKVATSKEATLFPPNCRFLYAKRKKTIVVIEEKPQVRSLLLHSALTNSPTRRFGLAMPYTVFVIEFSENQFAKLCVGWRTSPLNKLEDMLYKPLLSNIYDCLTVCMGDFTSTSDEISQKAQEVVSFFWNSQFDLALSGTWSNKHVYHSNLSTAESWEHFSKIDSSFILDVNLNTGSSVAHIVDVCTRRDVEPDEDDLRHKLTNEIDRCVTDLFKRVMNYFQKSKFEKHYPIDIQDDLKSALQFVSQEYNATIDVLRKELNKLEVDQKKSYGWKKIGKFWKGTSN